MEIQATVHLKNGVYVASSSQIDITREGHSAKEAVQNLKQAIESFLKVASQEEIQRRLKKNPPDRGSDRA